MPLRVNWTNEFNISYDRLDSLIANLDQQMY
jgi:hypothetical protein